MLLSKHEQQSSDPQHPQTRPLVVEHTYKPGTGYGGDKEIPGADWLANLSEMALSHKVESN